MLKKFFSLVTFAVLLASPLQAAIARTYPDALAKTGKHPIVIFIYGANYDKVSERTYEDFIKKNNIEDFKAYFQPFVNEYNKTATPYKKIGLVKVRDEEFPKNTLRKILRFKLDMTID